MRKVSKDYAIRPASIEHNDSHNERLRRICKRTKVDTGKILPSIYKATDVKMALDALYHSKCAYCEMKIVEFQVEHYRPKAAVSEDTNHSGYFWLSYEWSNLLPICNGCNVRPSKGTKFPIAGVRVYHGSISKRPYLFNDHLHSTKVLLDEVPLLINPEEIDFRPEDYFKFDEAGEIQPATRKGSKKFRRSRKTIDDIRLNRDDLSLIRRKYLIDEMIKKIISDENIYLTMHTSHGAAAAVTFITASLNADMQGILTKCSPNHELSFFWTFIYKHFHFIIDKGVQPAQRTRFKNIITSFVTKNPIP